MHRASFFVKHNVWGHVVCRRKLPLVLCHRCRQDVQWVVASSSSWRSFLSQLESLCLDIPLAQPYRLRRPVPCLKLKTSFWSLNHQKCTSLYVHCNKTQGIDIQDFYISGRFRSVCSTIGRLPFYFPPYRSLPFGQYQITLVNLVNSIQYK